VTAKDFRRIALGLADAVESAHMGHPDFRVAGRIFATLGYPDRTCGVVMLTPEQQRQCLARIRPRSRRSKAHGAGTGRRS
jgi:hypothetical protein